MTEVEKQPDNSLLDEESTKRPYVKRPRSNVNSAVDILEEADQDLAAMVKISAIMKALRHDNPAKVRKWLHERYCMRHEFNPEKESKEPEAPKA